MGVTLEEALIAEGVLLGDEEKEEVRLLDRVGGREDVKVALPEAEWNELLLNEINDF